ncbi:MAG: hypothetical protein ACW99G_10235 [Candidatus Thorarchaeota archaeon]
MTKNKYSRCDDVSDVTGVKSSDKLLIVGNKTPLGFMKKYVKELVTCSAEELDSDYIKHQYFDKVFVCQDDVDINQVIDRSLGTVTFFIEDDRHRSRLQDHLDAYWYPSSSWNLVSNVGKCLITEAQGRSRLRGI